MANAIKSIKRSNQRKSGPSGARKTRQGSAAATTATLKQATHWLAWLREHIDLFAQVARVPPPRARMLVESWARTQNAMALHQAFMLCHEHVRKLAEAQQNLAEHGEPPPPVEAGGDPDVPQS
jgi:hypothetical protein